MNNIVIEGRLAQDPEQKQTQNGKMMTTYNIACDRQYDKEHVDYFHCLSFGQVADYVAKYGTVGMSIIAVGSVQIVNYQDKNGHRQTGINVMVNSVKFLSRNPKMENPQNQNGQQQSQGGYGQPTGRTQPSGGYGNGQRQQANGGGYAQNNNGYAPRGGGYGQQQNNNGYGNQNYSQPAAPDFMTIPDGMDGEIPFN